MAVDAPEVQATSYEELKKAQDKKGKLAMDDL
jgi:hypothetical protein